MEALATLNTNHVALSGQGRKQDESTIGFQNLANLVQATKENTVNLSSGNCNVLNVKSDALNSLVELLLGEFDGLRGFTSDQDITGIATGRIWGAVTVHRRERRWEVDGSSSGRFDELDVLTMTTTDKLMAGNIKFCHIDDTTELQKKLGVTYRTQLSGSRYQSIDLDQDTGLCMLR